MSGREIKEKAESRSDRKSGKGSGRAYVVRKVSVDGGGKVGSTRLEEVNQENARSYPPCLRLHRARSLSP